MKTLREMTHFEGILQLYAQEQWHAEAVIIGNREALFRLRAVIDKALKEDEANGEFWASDGEGYGLVVKVVGEGWHEPVWETLPMSYTDEMAKSKSDSLKAPLSLCQQYLKEVANERKKA